MAFPSPAQYLDKVGRTDEEGNAATASDVLCELGNAITTESVFANIFGRDKTPRTASGLIRVSAATIFGHGALQDLFAGAVYLLKAVKSRAILKGGSLTPFEAAPEKRFKLVHVLNKKDNSFKVWFEFGTPQLDRQVYVADMVQWAGNPTTLTVCLRSDD